MEQAAYQWRRCNEEAKHVLRGLDRSQWIEVRYEELCANPDETLHRILTFLGLDPHKRVADFRSVENHIVGNGMRLDGTSDIRLDERWRQRLTDEDLQMFNHVAGETNRRCGYV